MIDIESSLFLHLKAPAKKLLPTAVRIMRALVGLRFFEERAENTYEHSSLSRELIDATFRIMIVGMCVLNTAPREITRKI